MSADTILDHVLQSSSSILLYGRGLAVAELVDRIRESCGDLDPLDLRGAGGGGAPLRQKLHDRAKQNRVIVALLSEQTDPEAWRQLDGLLEEELAGVRVVALVNGAEPRHDAAAKFPVRLSVEAALRTSAASSDATA